MWTSGKYVEEFRRVAREHSARLRADPGERWHVPVAVRRCCAMLAVMGVRALVRNGRIIVDEPTALPEGTILDLVVDDEGDDLDEAEREALLQRLDASWKSAREGNVRPAQAIIDELRAKR